MEFGIIVLIGMLFGSFAALCIYRLPRAQPIVVGTSRCDFCKTPLSWRHKLPLLGYILTHGRSSCCGQEIPKRYVLLEVFVAALFAILYLTAPSIEHFINASTLFVLLIIGSLTDLDFRIIPNKLTYTGIVIGLFYAFTLPYRLFFDAVAGALLCGGFLYLSAFLTSLVRPSRQVMGGGDIKFATMIGAFLGWQAGILTIVLAAFSALLFFASKQFLQPSRRQTASICFGPFLAFSAMVAHFQGQKFIDWYLSILGGF